MPGPVPEPAAQRRRRNAVPASVVLPAGGRPGKAPSWPLDEQAPGESGAWRSVWSLPQAVQWERLGMTRTVARYVRAMVRSEAADAPASLMAEARQLEDRLGLTPMAMLRLWWEISDDDAVAEPSLVVVKPDRWNRQSG